MANSLGFLCHHVFVWNQTMRNHGVELRKHEHVLVISVRQCKIDRLSEAITSHSTQNRSFRRCFSRPICWLCRRSLLKFIYSTEINSAAGEVTAGLAESNGSLPPGGWLTVTWRLTAYTPGSAPGPTLSVEYGKAFTFTFLPKSTNESRANYSPEPTQCRQCNRLRWCGAS